MEAVKVRLFWCALLALPLTSKPALACSVVPRPPMSDEEYAAAHQRYLREWVETTRASIAIVEIRAISTSRPNAPSFLAEVTRSYGGKIRRGTILRFRVVEAAMCGPGGLRKGERGITIISSTDPRVFTGSLTLEEVTLLRSEGIIAKDSR